jgi:hypothetical protein
MTCDKKIKLGCHTLLHSNIYGEIWTMLILLNMSIVNV